MKLLLTFLLACWPLAAVDLIWFSGAETGERFAEWGDTFSASINSNRVHTGTYSIEIAGSGQIWTTDFNTGITEIWTRCYVQTDRLPALDENVWRLRDSGGLAISTLTFNTDGTFELEGTTGTVVLDPDTWYLIEHRYKLGSGSNAEHQIWVDGTSDVNLSNGSQTAEPIAMDFESFDDLSAVTWYDDCAISSTGRVGDGESIALRPNADASPDLFESFSAGSTTWTEVDDDPVTEGTGARAPSSGGPPVNQEWDLTTEASVGAINTVRLIARALTTAVGGGGSETIRPDGTNDIVEYGACVSTTIDDDPDSEGGDYCNGLGLDQDTEVDVEMGNPDTAPSTGTNEQEVRACFISTGEANDPTCSIDILEGNTVRVNNVFSGSISQTSGDGCLTVSAGTWTWVPGDWTDKSGDSIQVGVDCVAGGGGPTTRASGALGSVELNLTLLGVGHDHELIANNANASQSSKSGDLSLTASFAWYRFKPTGAVVPTSQADLDAYRVGAEQGAAGAPAMDVSEMYLMVDHDGVPPPAGGKRRAMVGLIATLNLIRSLGFVRTY